MVACLGCKWTITRYLIENVKPPGLHFILKWCFKCLSCSCSCLFILCFWSNRSSRLGPFSFTKLANTCSGATESWGPLPKKLAQFGCHPNTWKWYENARLFSVWLFQYLLWEFKWTTKSSFCTKRLRCVSNDYMGVSLNGGTQNTPKWSFLVGKPMVVGYHHFGKPLYGTSQFLHDSSYLLSEFLRLLPHQSLPDFPYQRSTSRPPKGAMCSKVKRPEGPADMFKYFQVSSKVIFHMNWRGNGCPSIIGKIGRSPSERKQINTKSTPLIFSKKPWGLICQFKIRLNVCVDATQNPEKQMPKACGVPFSSKIKKRLLKLPIGESRKMYPWNFGSHFDPPGFPEN